MTTGYPTTTRPGVGGEIADPYRWLERDDDPRTVRWLEAQHRLAHDWLSSVPVRPGLRDRLAAFMSAGMVGTPVTRGGHAFFTRRDTGQPHPVLVVRRPDGTERVLVDAALFDRDGGTTLDAWSVDPQGRRLAYQTSAGGTERAALRVLEVATGRDIDGPIDGTRYAPVAWLRGGEAFHYVRRQAGSGPRAVWRHDVGGAPSGDRLLFGPLADTDSCGLHASPDGRRLVISTAAGPASPMRLWLAGAEGRPRPLRAPGGGRAVARVGDDGLLYLLTTSGAPRGRVCVVDPAGAHRDRWRELVPEPADEVLTDLAVLGDHIVVAGRSPRGPSLGMYERSSGRLMRRLPLPGPGTVDGLGAERAIHYRYTDHVTSPTIFRHAPGAERPAPWIRPTAGRTAPSVTSRSVEYESADGTRVPLLVLSPAQAATGPRPTMLTAYGGFGVASGASHDPAVLAWIDAGGVYAEAGVRGGSEHGEAWHDAGCREHKQRSIDDLVAAAEHLIAEGVTTPARLGACGGSNGGLLVAAALVQRPELFAAAVCCAPLTDMVRYPRFGMGKAWIPEYGDPERADELEWLLRYSPYHRVRPGTSYPPVLCAAFKGDSRVTPIHARKLCAALQDATVGGAPILLREESGVGHGRRSAGRAREFAADVLAFLAHHTGLDALPRHGL